MGRTPPSLDWQSIVDRGFSAVDVYDEHAAIIADMRAENLRRGGDDLTLGRMIVMHLAGMAHSLPFTPPNGQPDQQDPSQCVAPTASVLGRETGTETLILSKPWANLAVKADVRAWVAKASEEELREMAEFVLGDGPRLPALDKLQQHLLIAVNESEGFLRRVMAAQMQNEQAARQRQRETLKGIL